MPGLHSPQPSGHGSAKLTGLMVYGFMGLWFGVSTVGFMVWGLGLGFRLEVRYSAVVRQP